VPIPAQPSAIIVAPAPQYAPIAPAAAGGVVETGAGTIVPLAADDDTALRSAEVQMIGEAARLQAEGATGEAECLIGIETQVDTARAAMEAGGVTPVGVAALRTAQGELLALADELDAEGRPADAAALRAMAAELGAEADALEAELAAAGEPVAQRNPAARIPVATLPTGRTR
jgi:hypothetical protein